MYKFILKPMSIHTLYADAVQNADRVYHCDANSMPQTNKKEKKTNRSTNSINYERTKSQCRCHEEAKQSVQR